MTVLPAAVRTHFMSAFRPGFLTLQNLLVLENARSTDWNFGRMCEVHHHYDEAKLSKGSCSADRAHVFRTYSCLSTFLPRTTSNTPINVIKILRQIDSLEAASTKCERGLLLES
jgi:hypothetical protein